MDFRWPDVAKELAESDSGSTIFLVGKLDLWVEEQEDGSYQYELTHTQHPERCDPTLAGSIVGGEAGYDTPMACFLDGLGAANDLSNELGHPYQEVA